MSQRTHPCPPGAHILVRGGRKQAEENSAITMNSDNPRNLATCPRDRPWHLLSPGNQRFLLPQGRPSWLRLALFPSCQPPPRSQVLTSPLHQGAVMLHLMVLSARLGPRLQEQETQEGERSRKRGSEGPLAHRLHLDAGKSSSFVFLLLYFLIHSSPSPLSLPPQHYTPLLPVSTDSGSQLYFGHAPPKRL